MSKKELEESLDFTPQFDEQGLIPCITTCSETGIVLMFAYMNQDALHLSIETKEAHYWSRSRQSLWHKGATSGQVQKIVDMRTDCDQDCIWITVEMASKNSESAACHTGRKSCFYRVIEDNSKLIMKKEDSKQIFDPNTVYKD